MVEVVLGGGFLLRLFLWVWDGGADEMIPGQTRAYMKNTLL